jgi:predicted HicB family RNase H-like nuclease
MTKAAIPAKPSAQKAKYLGSLAETPTFTADNMSETSLKDMSFKVDPKFHKTYKQTAAELGMSMRELLEETFNTWLKVKAEESESDK